jgi:UDP-glucose 4-epimerase
MKKILITGSAGYIGQHLVQLLKHNYKVTGIDHRWDAENFPFTKRMDIFNADKYTQYDAVVHLAAFVSVGDSTETPSEYYLNNIEGTARLLDNIGSDNIIFASTGAAANPTSPYARSKLCAEDIIRQFASENYTIFRFYNVIGSEYGIEPTNPDGLMMALRNAVKTGEFNLYGNEYTESEDGTALRDYIHVMDVCRTIEKAIENPTNGIEELGTGHYTSVQEMVDIYKKVNNVDFEVVVNPRRPGDLAVSYCKNVSPLFTKSVTILDMMKETK